MRRRYSQNGIISEIFIYAFLCAAIIVTIYPFLNVLALSFNQSADTTRGINMIIPRVWTLDNYRALIKYENLINAAFISVLRTVLGTVVGVLSAATLAYTLSRKDYVFRGFLGAAFVITMYVSGGIVPWYLLQLQLGLNNTFWVYIIPGLIGTWNVIVIRSFMDKLPFELQESAKLDGAGDFTIFRRIIFPLCTPVLATVSLWVAVGHWNSWFDTYIFITGRPELTTLQFELFKILENVSASQAQAASQRAETLSSSSGMVTPMSIRMACTVVVTLPILIVYPFIQKFFVSGMTLGAVKS